jgi:hypothetical protein
MMRFTIYRYCEHCDDVLVERDVETKSQLLGAYMDMCSTAFDCGCEIEAQNDEV